MTTTTTTQISTTRVTPNKPPSTICSGFIDLNGLWNNGFACPIHNFVQYYCCGMENDHYCCPPDRYVLEINSHPYESPIYISGQYQPSDQRNRSLLIDLSYMTNRQFQQFQKLFLPIFLLASSILFLIGIAIWFWLFKHKAFYATEHDDLPPSASKQNHSLTRKRDSINLTLQEKSRRMSHPSTEV